MVPPRILHPIVVFLSAQFVLILTAAYTRRGSRLRYLTLAFLALCTAIFPWSVDRFVHTTGWIGRVPSGAMFWTTVTCFDRLIRRGWDYEHYEPKDDNPKDLVLEIDKAGGDISAGHHNVTQYRGTRMDFGNAVNGDARGIGHFWEVKNVPYFSDSDPTYIPSRINFILSQGFVVLTCYYVHNFTVTYTAAMDPELLNSSRVPLLTRVSDVSGNELKARAIASFGYWIIQYTNMQVFYSGAALLAALSSPQSIKLWRPLFGPPLASYSLRMFWGEAWHQTLRSGLEGMSDFLAHGILQLPRKGLLQRYTKILICFAISGVLHVRADMGAGMTARRSGAMQYFLMQALGITFEDGVQYLWEEHIRRMFGSRFDFVAKMVGYVWVLFFFLWTSAVWVFPYMLIMRKEDALHSLVAVRPMFASLI